MNLMELLPAMNLNDLHTFSSKVKTKAESLFFFSSRRRHTRFDCDWSSDVCSSDLGRVLDPFAPARRRRSVERLEFLAALERMLAGEGLTPLLHQARFGVPISELEIGRASCRERV